MHQLLRYWHTLRHLRPVQFYGRLWFRLYRPRPRNRRNRGRTTFSQLERLHPAVRNPSDELKGQSPFPLLRPISMLGPARFRFLNQTQDAIGPEAWNDAERDKLWLYNLHYFDDLNAADALARADWHRALVQRWINENPPGQGNGWEPYPTSLRIVNWVKWLLREGVIPAGKPEARPGTGNLAASTEAQQPNIEVLNSLATQAYWLRHRLEHHLLGNHLFANAKALVFAGAFFVGPEAKRWLRRGQRLLYRELNEQILADGGHFERSPMYHAILLEDLLDLLTLADVYPGVLDASLLALGRAKAVAMLDWLAAMTHPDGQISFFNDAAFGIAPTLAQLERYARAISIAADMTNPAPSVLSATSPSVIPAGTTRAEGHSGREAGIQAKDGPSQTTPALIWLRDSGYIRLQAGPALALLDVAPIGPDYLPGHAHADTLSFELSIFGQPVIVNGGTSRYGTGPERLAERGTAAHSTVQIDGADSSEVWGGFRVARRARPFDVVVNDLMAGSDHHRPGSVGPGATPVYQEPDQGSQGARSSASQLNDKPEEKGDRTPVLAPLLVSAAHDGYRRLPGRSVHRRQWLLAEDRLVVTDRIEGDCHSAVARFHLHPEVEASIKGTQGVLRLPDGSRVRWGVTGGQPRLVPDRWHPEFGCSLPSQCLEVEIAGDQCVLELSWQT
ncbi:alginate lyase family protein [Lamprobacter modestohalophilus]|uniref:heparinase II/III family protein n=1 Tax=Lamprobacter modestohalophilus TaxID=1064514 RepID=UPI002ADEBA20|nr:alginate lyase family protein [Lamprobacter modestohalophilus]MEA1049046.1 alginate lyase family protein [Lamprobacter modestohalophilus]